MSPEKSQGMTSIWGKGGQASFDLPDDYVKDYLKVSFIIKQRLDRNILKILN